MAPRHNFMHFPDWKTSEFHSKFYSQGSNKQPTLCQTDNKPLSEPVMSKFNDPYVHHLSASHEFIIIFLDIDSTEYLKKSVKMLCLIIKLSMIQQMMNGPCWDPIDISEMISSF